MPATRPSLRSLLVPTEHGGWGFTLEPGLLGILVAPGATSAGLAVFALFAFLADRPLRMALGDAARRRMLARTPWAAAVAGVYGAAAGAGLAVAAATAGRSFWWVLAAAIPFVATQLALEARGRTRSAVREIAGPVAIASVAAAAAVADGQGVAVSLGLWAVLALRITTSVVLVRAQIRRVRGRPAAGGLIAGAHAAGVVAAAALAAGSIVSWPAAGAIGLLAMWAAIALAMPPVRAAIVGVTQMTAGLAVVLVTAAGHPPG